MAVLPIILAPLFASICIAKPVGSRVADMPLFATDSVATFTWADATQTTTATFTHPKREAVPTWPRRIHHPLNIAHLAQSDSTSIRIPHGDEEKDLVVTPKHQIEHPVQTGVHHEPISLSRSQPTSRKSHTSAPTKTSISFSVPTEIVLLHEAAILHERRDVSTVKFTGPSTTATFTFTSPTGTDAFSSLFTLIDTTGLPLTTSQLDNRVTTAAPTPSAYPVNGVDTCAEACDAADVSCSSLLTSYTANSLW